MRKMTLSLFVEFKAQIAQMAIFCRSILHRVTSPDRLKQITPLGVRTKLRGNHPNQLIELGSRIALSDFPSQRPNVFNCQALQGFNSEEFVKVVSRILFPYTP